MVILLLPTDDTKVLRRRGAREPVPAGHAAVQLGAAAQRLHHALGCAAG